MECSSDEWNFNHNQSTSSEEATNFISHIPPPLSSGDIPPLVSNLDLMDGVTLGKKNLVSINDIVHERGHCHGNLAFVWKNGVCMIATEGVIFSCIII